MDRNRRISMYDSGWHLCPTPEEVDEYTKKLSKQFRQNRKATEHDPLY
jgi:hypothetical protein